jgi:hypothetical protein
VLVASLVSKLIAKFATAVTHIVTVWVVPYDPVSLFSRLDRDDYAVLQMTAQVLFGATFIPKAEITVTSEGTIGQRFVPDAGTWEVREQALRSDILVHNFSYC